MKTNSISKYIPPYEYFSCKKQAIFQTIQATKKEDWYDLLNPAEWWKENYNFKKYNWNITNNIEKIKRYKMALNMIFE